MRDFLTFRRMITPIIIQIVFWLGVIGCVIAGIGMMLSASATSSLLPQMPGPAQGFQIVGGLGLIVFGPLVCRIYCELLILLFRMNESLTDIKRGLAPGVSHQQAA